MRRVVGTSLRPRLSVFRSNRHISAQIVDDQKGITIAGFSSNSSELASKKFKNPQERAKETGRVLARMAIKEKIKEVVFDRRNYKYHGQVKELAEGAREGGLKF